MPKHIKKYILLVLILFSIIIILRGAMTDLKNIDQYMSNDLRNRVVAAGLLNEGINPYFYKWTPGESIKYLDPRDFPSRSVSRVTVPPTVLVIQSMFIELSYKVQKYLWLLFQWLALLLSIFFLTADIKDKNNKILLSLSMLVIFSGAWFWRFHVDAGQLYIIYVMLFSASYYIMKKNNNSNSFISGLILGFLAGLRPNTIVFLIPLIVLKKIRIISGVILGFFVNILISFSIWDIYPWINYSKAIGIHEQIHLGLLNVDMIPNSIIYDLKDVEGVTRFDDISRFLYTDSSLQVFFGLSSKDLVITLAIVLASYTAVLFINRKNIDTVNLIFLAGITAVIISEFFIPAARLAYYDVIWIIPLCIMAKLNIDYERKIFNIVLLLVGIFTLSIAEIFIICGFIGPYISLIATIYATSIYTRGLAQQKIKT